MQTPWIPSLFFLLLCHTFSAPQTPLTEPTPTIFVDNTQIIALAEQQTFTLPVTTRTISHRLEMYPQSTQECWFSSQSLLYKPLASTYFVEEEEAKISNMLALNKKQKLFLVDQQNNIFSYSLDEHFLLKKLAPRTSFAGLNKKVTTLVMTATQDQETVYFITPQKYFIFNVQSLGLEILHSEELKGDLKDVQKVLVYKDNLILLSAESGLLIYKIKEQNKLALAQTFTFPKDLNFRDMQFDATSQLLYLLAFNRPLIKIYHFEDKNFPNDDKSLTVFGEYDSIDFASVTNRHNHEKEETNTHIRLQISKNRQQQTLLVLFLHRYHYVVAEMSYDINLMNWNFVRYFKFAMRVNQIHIINDLMAVLGSQTMGLFPFGIHPKLIEQEFNGEMTLTSMSRLAILKNGRFVGLTKNSIQYGVIKLQQKAQLNCKIEEQSTLKTVKLLANLTACTNQDKQMYETYCQYQKTFALQQMQLTVSAPVANILWTGMLFFILLIILGIIILFAIQRNKEEEIKRLEEYFQHKKTLQNQGVVSSERGVFSSN